MRGYQYLIRKIAFVSLLITWMTIRTQADAWTCLSGRLDCTQVPSFYCAIKRGAELCSSSYESKLYCTDDNLCLNDTRQGCVCTFQDAFDCGNGRCVDKNVVCDSQNDCKNGMDETNCSIGCSDAKSFECTDGSCIPYNLICDGISHCKNGFDEEGCDMDVMNECTSERYRRCDGRIQARRIDQKSCFALVESKDCTQRKGQLITINSKRKEDMVVEYIHANYIEWSYYRSFVIGIGLYKVNGNRTHADFMWADGSPLTYTNWSSNQPAENRCFMLLSEGRVLTWIGYEGCTYINNDILCEWTSHANTDAISALPEGNITSENRWDVFQCGSGEWIKVLYVCDKINDCADNSDERNCDELWLTGSYHCDDGTRLNIGQWCDFSFDCVDRSDEINCVVNPCNNYQWRCDSGQCVPLSVVCDNKFDCFDHSDEGIACYGNCLARDVYACSVGEIQKCIQRSLATDDVYDCPENEDTPVNTFPACPANKAGTFYVDVGSDLHGPIAVDCEATKIEIKAISIEREFDSVNNLTIVILRYGSDYVVDRLIKLYEKCTQHFSGDTMSIFTQRFTNERPVTGQGVILSRNVTPFCGYTGYTICEYTTNLPIRTLAFEELDMFEGNLSPVITCEGPISDKHNELFSLEAMSCKTTGTRIYARNKCLLNIKPDGSPFGCRDLTHLEDCEEFRCPDDYVKCPNSFCLHVRLFCDGQPHCPHGEDEHNCANYTCKGMYSCRKRPGCLPGRLLCDGIIHCPLGDDEELCDFICPPQCTCENVALTCKIEIGHESTTAIGRHVRYLDLSKIVLSKKGYCELSMFRMLLVLNISGCGLNFLTPNICENPLTHLNNLRTLDISNNKFKYIQFDAFVGLYNLKKIILDGNAELTVIEPSALGILTTVTHAHISSTNIKHLDKHVFTGMAQLKFLDISYNGLAIDIGTFGEVPLLEYLDVRGNNVPITHDVFDGITFLQVLYTDFPTLCCIMKAEFNGAKCVAPESYISSCDDLIGNELLRISIWIIGGAALVGNTFVIIYRVGQDVRGKLKTHSVLVTSLGLSDFLMGVYTLLIAAVDVTYRGEYIEHDVQWRKSPLCTFAGILSTLSSELSALLICIIAVDRYIAIKYPFSKLSVRHSVILVVIAGIVGLLIAIIPVLSISYFGGEFYSRSAVCVALPLTDEHTQGWEYSVGIFIIFNLIIFIVIGIVQIMLYREVKSTSAKARAKQAKVDAAVAKSLTTVIMTDFCCWFPIGVMGCMSLAGYQISSEVYAWVIVFVLPINSALNPFLYTISALRQKKRSTVDSQATDAMTTSNDILQIHHRITHQGPMHSGRKTDYMPLSKFLTDHSITTENIEMIKKRIEDDLEFFHYKEFFHGHISEETVSIKMDANEMADVLLEFEHKRITKHMSKQDDMNSLAELIRRLRQIASLNVTAESVGSESL